MSSASKQQRIKGDAFLSEANKKLSERAWLASSKERKFEEAAELFEQAANAYKVGGFQQESGDAYAQAAELYKDKLGNVGDATKCWSNAGSCYKKVNQSEAINAFRKAISLLSDNGRLSQAAKMTKEVAELFENDESADGSNVALAIESYEQAAEFFNMENQKSQANQCIAKVAELSSAAIEPPDFLRAASLYEGLGKNCLETNLLKYNAKGYFLQGLLCYLASGDSIGASQAQRRYEALDYTFSDSREGKFAAALIACVEGFDSEGFATACSDFDRITKLDPWKTSVLVRIKRSLNDGGLGDGDNDVDLT